MSVDHKEFHGQDRMKEVTFFDQFVQNKEYDVLTEQAYHVFIRSFRSLAKEKLSPSSKIVDLGCGTGAFTKRLYNHIGGETWGVDISSNSIAVANRRNEGIRYAVGDITDLEFKDETFDVVIYSGVLHHFQDFQHCLKEGYRILKKGGCVLSYDPHLYNPFMFFYRYPLSPFFSNLGKTDNERLVMANQMKQAFRAAGFKMPKTVATSGITFRYVESSLAKKFLPVYNVFENFLGWTPLSNLIGSFLICYAEK